MSEDADQPIPSNPTIDTHVHLWDLNQLDLPWLADDAVQPIHRSFTMEDYLQATQDQNIVQAVYLEVNVHSDHQDQEAQHVLNLCTREDNPLAAAILGGSPQSPNFSQRAHRYADNPYVRGFRVVLHEADRPQGMCLQPQFVENIQLLGKLGLRFELCMRPAELLDGVHLVEQCPRTQFILDHCGCLGAQSTDKAFRESWMAAMRVMAQQENVALKISGIVASAAEDWKREDLAPNVEFCLDTFGEEKVCFGGDWPVCTLRASYNQWIEALRWIVRDRSPQATHKLFHDNAIKLYALGSNHE